MNAFTLKLKTETARIRLDQLSRPTCLRVLVGEHAPQADGVVLRWPHVSLCMLEGKQVFLQTCDMSSADWF